MITLVKDRIGQRFFTLYSAAVSAIGVSDHLREQLAGNTPLHKNMQFPGHLHLRFTQICEAVRLDNIGRK